MLRVFFGIKAWRHRNGGLPHTLNAAELAAVMRCAGHYKVYLTVLAKEPPELHASTL